MITDLQSVLRLASDARIPILGLGTWKLAEGREVIEAVSCALGLGYRHIDTAAAYQNETGVGHAIHRSGVPREEIFVTTKIWPSDFRQGRQRIRDAFAESLERLGLDYVDLYLLHWPTGEPDIPAWMALEELYMEKRARSIGVCNYLPHHLDRLVARAEVPPMVNQVEFHPYLLQRDLLAYCREHAIVQEAWAPLMQGRVNDVPEIRAIAERHGKTPAQVALRWELQHGLVTIPKSSRPERIAENAAVFDFALSREEMAAIDRLDRAQRFGTDPDHAPW